MDLDKFAFVINEALASYKIETLNDLSRMIRSEYGYSYDHPEVNPGTIEECPEGSFTYRMLLAGELNGAHGPRVYSEAEVENLIRFYEYKDLIKTGIKHKIRQLVPGKVRLLFDVSNERNGYELTVMYN